ncbi:MAG: hypothetical protein R1F54_10825 [Candidatus Zeuxoniibacter abyssi]|nr:MAG: hypothetical protein R1F54_10825 [Candidatus Persebacteraceae bacterium AB1(2)]
MAIETAMCIDKHRQAGGYTQDRWHNGKMSDVWFRNNKGITLYDIAPLLTQGATIKALPELAGSALLDISLNCGTFIRIWYRYLSLGLSGLWDIYHLLFCGRGDTLILSPSFDEVLL